MKVPAITQEYVQIRDFPGAAEAGYDALWDLLPGPDGRIYCGVSSEGETSRSARLYAYDPRTDRMDLVFKVADVTHPPENVIPQSKIHTSMAVMEDGRIIMCTHTTAPAPTHPVWAPWQCYHDLYEGYPGSHIIIYDPKTNKAEDMGIPVPRESTYGGGCYVSEVRQYFMLGLMKRHLYVFDLNTNRTYDRGFVDVGFRLFRDKKGYVYGIAPTGKMNRGRMWRYDPFRSSLQDLDLEVPGWDGVGVLSFVEEGPDGRFYFARLWSDHLMVFDPRSGTITDLGMGFADADRYSFGPPLRDTVRGMAGIRFMPDGKLYYGMVSGSLSELVALMRWDIFNHGQPEFLGFVFGDGQATVMISEMVVGADGRLYLGDTCNYGKPPRLVVVDAVKLPPAGPRSLQIPRRWHDPVNWSLSEKSAAITQRSADSLIGADAHSRVEIYDALLPASDCAVNSLRTDDGNRLHIVTAGGGLVLWDGKESQLAYRHPESICALDMSQGKCFFADRHSIWCYSIAPGKPRPVCWVELPEEYRISFFRCEKKSLYGLLEPGFRPFVITEDKKVWIGPPTGTLVPGSRIMILAPNGQYYLAQDEGVICAVRRGENNIKRTKLRLPGLKDRLFLARWTAAVVWDGQVWGGTNDGYIFQLNWERATIVNLGKPALSLGIQDMVVAGNRLYGIAGRGVGDLCRIFSWHQPEGFKDLGLLRGAACLAGFPDGRLAVGCGERIAHVDIYRFPKKGP